MCGNERLMERFKIDLSLNKLNENIRELESEGKTVFCFVIDKVPRLVISLEEEHIAKPEAKSVINYLQIEMGLKVAIITGDNKFTAFKVANYLNIKPEMVTYRAYPHQKKKVVKKL